MREMGWTWEELNEQPDEIVIKLLLAMGIEAEVRNNS
jgi:hypothetical protein